MGDFNSDMLSINADSKVILKFLKKNKLQLIPHGITNTSTERGTHIDLCIADHEDEISHFSTSSSPFINTHFLISATYSIFKISSHPESQFSYRKLNSIVQDEFTEFLRSSIDINNNASSDVNDKLTVLNAALTQALDALAPLISVTPRQKIEPWITREIFILQKQVDQAYRRYKRKRSITCRKEYRKLKLDLKYRESSARIAFYKNKLQDINDPKELWRELRNLGLTDSTPFKQPICTPEELNNFFISASNPPNPAPPCPPPCHPFRPNFPSFISEISLPKNFTKLSLTSIAKPQALTAFLSKSSNCLCQPLNTRFSTSLIPHYGLPLSLNFGNSLTSFP